MLQHGDFQCLTIKNPASKSFPVAQSIPVSSDPAPPQLPMLLRMVLVKQSSTSVIRDHEEMHDILNPSPLPPSDEICLKLLN